MNVRHMTLEEYKTNIIPSIFELKKIFRKKFLISADWKGLKHLTRDEYIAHEITTGEHRSKINNWEIDSTYYKEEAIRKWSHMKLKNTEIPSELYSDYRTIYNKLTPLYINQKNVDLSKAHKDHKTEIRKAISDDIYLKELEDGLIDFSLLENVCDSLGIKIPKRLYNMKEKVSQGLYNRGYLKANKEFLNSIRNHLTPYINKLKKLKRDQLLASMETFELSKYGDLYTYCIKELSRNMSIYNDLHLLYNGKVRVSNAPTKIEEICDDYSNQYINSFIYRMENKTNLINLKWGVPVIKFGVSKFRGGEFESTFSLIYSDGKEIIGDSKVVTAGGYIQCLHQRYLFHFYYNGSKISLEQIDNLV